MRLGERRRRDAIRQIRTDHALFSTFITGDVKPENRVNHALINGHMDHTFGVWRPPQPRPVREIERPRLPRPRRTYVPVVSPLMAVVVDAALLADQALRWTWRALDGSR